MPHLETETTRVEHLWTNDRFAHQILIRSADRWLPILDSVEGTAADAWPQSPPWQQMVEESIGPQGDNVLLGVGLSGNGHWSVAIGKKKFKNSSAKDGEIQIGLHFDIACKISKGAAFLGSTWRCCDGWTIESWTPEQVALRNASISDSFRWRLEANHGVFHLADSSSSGFLELVPTDVPSLVKTHRWAFGISRIVE